MAQCGGATCEAALGVALKDLMSAKTRRNRFTDESAELLPRAIPFLDPLRSEPVVSIVVITWNSNSWIANCLEGVQEAVGRLPYQVVVLDNASSDGTSTTLREFESGPVRVMRSEINLGFAAGVNRAVAEARGKYIFLLNPDCRPEAGAIRTLVEHLEAYPSVAAAVPLLTGSDGSPQREFQLRRFPTVGSLAVELLLLDKVRPANLITDRYRYRDLDISGVTAIEQPAAAAMLIRRELVERIGLFDESFTPAWFEDVDFCRRISAAGSRIDLVPAATAVHHGGASLDHVSFAFFTEVWYRNLNRYARKWFSPAGAELVRGLTVVGMLLRAVVAISGLVKVPASRSTAAKTYLSVAASAVKRWNDASPSS